MTGFSDILSNNGLEASGSNKNVFLTQKQAKSALAFAQLTHIMEKVYRDYDWRQDWEDGTQPKCCIHRYRNETFYDTGTSTYSFLAFPDWDVLKTVFFQNERLIRDYLMID